ncbi:MAG: GNAT family N-acetyltransferase [Gaiellaceae bacterium]
MSTDIAPQHTFHDAELYCRGTGTLLASWEEYARGAAGASLQRLPGAVAAVFPEGPERAVYNNAVLEGGAAAIDEVKAVYAAAGVDRYAVWVHESDRRAASELERRGYVLNTTTRAMGMALDEIRLPRPRIELAAPDWRESLRVMELPPDFLEAADPAAFEILIARLDGENVAAAIALDHDGDRGIYNVGTLEHARRRGLGTALTTLLVHDALARGCETASLQSTQMAERMYAGVGFRDLGRILEYVPTPSEPPRL